jgi:hypothetical protein
MTSLALLAALSLTAAAPDEQIQDDERPGTLGNRAGVVANLGLIGGSSATRAEPMLGVHGRIGMRFALLDRSDDPGRANVGLAVLLGGDSTNLAHGFGAEARIEFTAGGTSDLYQPFFTGFVAAGVQNIWFDCKPELHAGFGAGLDVIVSGILGRDHDLSFRAPHHADLGLVAVVAFLLAPSVELRWVQRPDGSTYKVALISVGV